MKLKFEAIFDLVKNICRQQQCSEVRAANIATEVWHQINALNHDISYDAYSKIKELNAFGTSAQRIAEMADVPVYKVRKILSQDQ